MNDYHSKKSYQTEKEKETIDYLPLENLKKKYTKLKIESSDANLSKSNI